MKEQRQKPEKPEGGKQKMHKDFGFLLEKVPIFINRQTAKYILEEGIDDIIDSYKENAFDAYFSYLKYDYDGKTVDKVAVAKISSDRAEPLRAEVLSMKIKEKAWFNISDQLIHTPSTKMELIEHGTIKEDVQQMESNEEEVVLTGFHYEMVLDRIQFKNAEKIEIKRKIYEFNREKGKKLFQESKFFEATKAYRFIINISENLPRNHPYSPEERGELESMNANAKLNYIRCYFKIEEDWTRKDLADFAKGVLDFLRQKKPMEHSTHFYHAKWLLRERVLDSALEAAKRSNNIKRNQATEQLINEILTEKRNKGKIKVPVPVVQAE